MLNEWLKGTVMVIRYKIDDAKPRNFQMQDYLLHIIFKKNIEK